MGVHMPQAPWAQATQAQKKRSEERLQELARARRTHVALFCAVMGAHVPHVAWNQSTYRVRVFALI